MLLVVDIGNTNIVIGVYRDTDLLHSWRLATLKERTADEYRILVAGLLESEGIEHGEVHDIIISSVVPPALPYFLEMARVYFGKEPIVVGPGVKTGMPIMYDNPREVGADRIVNAVAAFGVHYDEVTKYQRSIGKVIELACGYQGGIGAFKMFAKTIGVVIEEDVATRLIDAWRSGT